MTEDQIQMRNELLEPYAHVNLKYPHYPERTTAAEVLLRCAANEVVFARWWHPEVKRWNNPFPMESQGSVVGAYLKALRTGTIEAFNAQLMSITDLAERKNFITVMNARNVFIDDGDWMRNVAEVLYAIELIQSYD